MRGPVFLDEKHILFHGSKRRGPGKDSFALFEWNTASDRIQWVATGAIQHPAHASIGNKGRTIAFDSDEVWSR